MARNSRGQTTSGSPSAKEATRLWQRNEGDRKAFRFVGHTARQKADQTWFRGEHCNFNPTFPEIHSAGAGAAELFYLKGWLPETPVIGPQTKLVAFGSCFAQNITDWLAQRNFDILTRRDGPNSDAYVVRFGEGMVNTFAIRQQFEWAFEGKICSEELWHGYDAQAFGYDEQIRLKTRAVFEAAEVFVITLGLSEIWYDEVTGGVFWRAVPFDKYDSSRHKFRVSTVAENKANIHAILDLIHTHRPGATVILTLSPIPLVATFRPVSCISASSVSKAILRAAIDEAFRERPPDSGFYYWPSYELVMDMFANRWGGDRRHVKPAILDFIMVLFEKYWCRETVPKMSVAEALLRARIAEGTYPQVLAKALPSGDWKFAPNWIEQFAVSNGVELVMAYLREVRDSNRSAGRFLSELEAIRSRKNSFATEA
jgi:GSCFA family